MSSQHSQNWYIPKFGDHLGVYSELLYLVVLGLGHVAAVPVLGEHTQHLILAQLAPLQAQDLVMENISQENTI